MEETNPQRRSEIVRRKLNQESQSSVRKAAHRALQSPAIQRNSRIGLTTGKQRADQSDHVISAVKKHFKPGWRMLSFLLVGLLSYMVYTAWFSPIFRVTEIQISGLQRLDEKDISSQINALGKHVFAIIPQEIIDEISSDYPELREVHLSVLLPGKLSVSIIERQPMFAWKMKDFEMWVDTEGYLIPARGNTGNLLSIAADSPPLYQLDTDLKKAGITKIIQDKNIEKPALSELVFFSQPKHIDSTLLLGVLQLNAWMPNEQTLLYKRKRGLGWEDPRGWDVFVGQKLENINEKMVMYETIVRNLEKEGIQPSMVSVEFLHAPFYRMDEKDG